MTIESTIADRIVFNATLEDVVDTSVRFIRQSASLRRVRTNAIAVVGLMSGGGVLAALLSRADRLTTAPVLVGALAAIPFGVIAALVYRLFYDRSARHRIRKLALEQLRGAESIHCEMELRPAVLWIRQGGTELAFQWTAVLAVNDLPEGIEFKFKAGLVVARNRAFPTDAARQGFLQRAKNLADI